MVIQKFNKLIRNKLVWSVFAIIVSAAFCFDSLFNSRGDESVVGVIAGEPVKREQFVAVYEDIVGRGVNSRADLDQDEVTRTAKERLAVLKVAENLALEVSDDEIKNQIRSQPAFSANGAFDFKVYDSRVRELGLTPNGFESMLKRMGAAQRVELAVGDAVSLVSPLAVDRAVYDYTDVFTVRVASFTQQAKDADKVKLDEAGLKKWYDENTNNAALKLPKRYRVKYIKADATAKDILDKMTVAENDMLDFYDANYDRYVSYDTNGVEVVKKFEEVKPEIEKELRRVAAVEYLREKFESSTNSFDEIAKEMKLKAAESPWFAEDGSVHEGFCSSVYAFAPGAEEFIEAVVQLYDSASTADSRQVVNSRSAVWLLAPAKAAVCEAGFPKYEECKEIIRPRALRDARAKAFKDSVTAVKTKGFDAVCAGKNVSTNITFCSVDMAGVKFDNQYEVVGAALRLNKGEVSDFVLTAPGKALLVACVDRKPGDPAKVLMLGSDIRRQLSSMSSAQILPVWRKWNLDRLGVKLNSDSNR